MAQSQGVWTFSKTRAIHEDEIETGGVASSAGGIKQTFGLSHLETDIALIAMRLYSAVSLASTLQACTPSYSRVNWGPLVDEHEGTGGTGGLTGMGGDGGQVPEGSWPKKAWWAALWRGETP